MVLKWIKWSAPGENSRRQTQHTRVPRHKPKTCTCTQNKTRVEPRGSPLTCSIKSEGEDTRVNRKQFSTGCQCWGHTCKHTNKHTSRVYTHVFGSSASLRVFINACGLYTGATGNGAIWFGLSCSSASIYWGASESTRPCPQVLTVSEHGHRVCLVVQFAFFTK